MKLSLNIMDMKKFLLTAAFAAACLGMTAQEKGDFAVGGSIGVSGGTTTSSVTVAGNKTSSSEPSSTTLEFNPEFSYFVIDNLELSAGLSYGMQKDFTGTTRDEKNLFSFTHVAMATIGVNYYIPLIREKLFWTPGVKFGFGGGSYVSQTGQNNSSTVKVPFAFGFTAEVGTLEFKPLDYLGIYLNALDLAVSYVTLDTGSRNVISSSTGFTGGFNYGISAGVKYYF